MPKPRISQQALLRRVRKQLDLTPEQEAKLESIVSPIGKPKVLRVSRKTTKALSAALLRDPDNVAVVVLRGKVCRVWTLAGYRAKYEVMRKARAAKQTPATNGATPPPEGRGVFGNVPFAEWCKAKGGTKRVADLLGVTKRHVENIRKGGRPLVGPLLEKARALGFGIVAEA